MALDQLARVIGLLGLQDVERRDDGTGAGAALHQVFQRQPRQRIADAGQARAIAAGEKLLVDALARRQLAEDDVEQDLAHRRATSAGPATSPPASRAVGGLGFLRP